MARALAADRSAPVGGFRVFAFRSADELITAIRQPTILVALNAEKIGAGDDRVRRIVNDNTGYPDGMGVVLALRRKGLRTQRIAGADLWLPLLRSRPAGCRLYVIGSTRAVIRLAARRLHDLLPELVIVGQRDGYFDGQAFESVRQEVVAARPDVVLVAMGTPRQELLMAELTRAWPAIYMGLGGSLDVFVGRRRRAPRWMQRLGLEWVFRFVEDPSRLPRLSAYLRFAWLLARGRL